MQLRRRGVGIKGARTVGSLGSKSALGNSVDSALIPWLESKREGRCETVHEIVEEELMLELQMLSHGLKHGGKSAKTQ